MLKLEEDEHILYIARKHWFLFVSQTLFLFLFAFLPAVILFVPAPISTLALTAAGIGDHLILLLTFFWSLWLMFLWTLLALFWTNFYLDVWVVTNFRVIDIEQISLFNRKISAFRYDHIQDVSVKVSGLLATLVDFGTVEIRTASEESFDFKGVAHPNFLKEKIMSEHHRVHTQS